MEWRTIGAVERAKDPREQGGYPVAEGVCTQALSSPWSSSSAPSSEAGFRPAGRIEEIPCRTLRISRCPCYGPAPSTPGTRSCCTQCTRRAPGWDEAASPLSTHQQPSWAGASNNRIADRPVLIHLSAQDSCLTSRWIFCSVSPESFRDQPGCLR